MVEVEILESGNWRILLLNEPKRRNPISSHVEEVLRSEFEYCRLSNLDFALAGNGPAFSSGADLRELAVLDEVSAYNRSIKAQKLLLEIANSSVRSLAVVCGACLGKGFELILSFKVVAASPEAWFQFPEHQLGFEPGSGGLKLLERRCGKEAAFRMFADSSRLSAANAANLGIVDVLIESCPTSIDAVLLDKIYAKANPCNLMPAPDFPDETLARKYATDICSQAAKQAITNRLTQ